MTDPATTATPIRPASTAIVMRERADGAPEFLMIQRSSALSFAGAWVFPGGAVDAGDRALAGVAAASGVDLEEQAGRIAAIRETIEEAGCPIGLVPVPDPQTLATIRAALHAGTPLADLLDAHGLRLVLDDLVPFARWITPPRQPKRFDTRFYLVRASAEAAAEADGTETAAVAWATAREMLDIEERELMFPTALSLHRLALHDSFASAAAHSALQSRDPIEPHVVEVEGERFLAIREGRGFPDIRYPVSGRR